MSVKAALRPSAAPTQPHADRVGRIDWQRIADELDGGGSAILDKLLAPEECTAIAALYPDDAHFAATSS